MRPVALTLIVMLTVGGLAMWVDADAQRGPQVPRIGVLQVGTRPAVTYLFEAFRQAMRELGYVEGRVVYEHRFGENRTDRLQAAAAELLRLKMDVIVTSTDQGIAAVKQQTRTIPIVMATARIRSAPGSSRPWPALAETSPGTAPCRPSSAESGWSC